MKQNIDQADFISAFRGIGLGLYEKSKKIKNPKNDMEALCSQLSVFEGEDVYLTDGAWLRPDGTMYDEKN